VQGSLGSGWAYTILWDGMAQGFIAAVAFVLPFILPFYIFLALLEDSGYLARVAVLMDSTMHRLGLHGKAFIPLVLGYGCSVPAVLGTRILETRRERIIAGFLATMIPCAARTVVIMALVGVFLGWYWALGFYILNLGVVFVLGRASSRLIPGQIHGLIMEVPRYHMPQPAMVMRQTWMRLKDFVVVALPILVIGSVLLVLLESTGASDPINLLFSPLTVWLLGLPVGVGLILVLGVFRKELTLAMLLALVNELNYSGVHDFMTSGQIIVFTLFVMFYIPCVSTLAAMLKEYGMKVTARIALAQIALAVLIAGMANLILGFGG
jgi:ferrous iron transport protein B